MKSSLDKLLQVTAVLPLLLQVLLSHLLLFFLPNNNTTKIITRIAIPIVINNQTQEIKQYYTNEDFGIENYISLIDKDNDGIDDQTDILENVYVLYIRTVLLIE